MSHIPPLVFFENCRRRGGKNFFWWNKMLQNNWKMMNLFRTSWLGYWRLGAEAHTPNLIPKYAKCRFRVNKISNMYTMLHVRIINWITHFCRAHFTIRTVIRIPKLLLSTIIIIFRIQYFLSNFFYSVSEHCTSWKVMLLRKIYMKKKRNNRKNP